ncbi:hypothetical protein [Massilia sp. METH4]|uniref:hypothetical protein n=1 Tax=Massilia sp. METH4 TaxID=3123041 RepID=UPI0030CE75D6
MAGAILIAKKNGVSLSTINFDYIIEKIRADFCGSEAAIMEEIHSPVDNGGFSFISLGEQNGHGFNVFVRAASIARETDLREQPLSCRRHCWDELMMALRADPRAEKS